MTAGAAKSSYPRRIKRIGRGTLIGILIGVVSGLGAILFNFLLKTGTHFFLQDLPGFALPPSMAVRLFLGIPLSRWMMIWIPALGGLISGLLVFTFAPEAEGHGTDAMIDSFHRKKGIIRRRVPVIKTIASAITIGSGGSAGKEGPIAQIGAGFGSFLASLLRVSDRERRIMLLAGAAGGIGAIFKAPLGAALFATEVLYRKEDFEFEALIPCILSSIVAFMVFTFHDGDATIFHIPQFSLATPAQLPFYAVLGVLCAVVGFPYVWFFYGMRDRFFRRLSLPSQVKPAIGGLMVGLIAVFLPQVLGGGYAWIQSAIDGRLAVPLMAALIFAKIVATSCTISSGGSGGVFAPSLFIGSMLGGAFGTACHRFFPHIVAEPSAFVLVGMGGVLRRRRQSSHCSPDHGRGNDRRLQSHCPDDGRLVPVIPPAWTCVAVRKASADEGGFPCPYRGFRGGYYGPSYRKKRCRTKPKGRSDSGKHAFRASSPDRVGLRSTRFPGCR
jgi:CIC family chloride channel protein